ncbi:MAG: Nif3-like dinuclear metal center hexameric protein [Ruminococcaceae bacterium]|nr:Nif3-like dinuclear metal center hexameric protein [Oscillospiraceae bacterium]
MTTKELYNYLNERIPAELSEDWDNDGRMLISSDREIKRVLISLDVTGETVSKAVKESFDLIITHHPLIFKPVKGITDERFLTLIKADISVFSFHTRLDAVEGGVNDALASLLGLKNTEAFEEMGRIGELDKEMTAEEFAHFVKNTLGAPLVNFTDSEKKIKRAALLGGGGKDFWQAASAEADAYVTGEMSHNTLLDAHEQGFCVVEAGHYFTEFPVCRVLEAMVKDLDPGIETEIFDFYPVKSI